MKTWLSVLLLLLCSSCLVSAYETIPYYELVEKWSVKAPFHSDATRNVFSDGKNVYRGSCGDVGNTYKIRLSDGKVLWSAPIRTSWTSNPVSNGKVVVFGMVNKPAIVGLDDSTGKVRWRIPTGQQTMSAAAFAGNFVFIGSADRHVYAINWATGKLRWKTAVGSGVTSKPLIRNNLVIIGCDDGYLYCIDKSTGKIRKKINCGGAVDSEVLEFNGKIFVTAGTLTMGRTKKKMTKSEQSEYLSKLHSRILVIDPGTGKIIDEVKTPGSLQFGERIVGQNYYVFFEDWNHLYCYNTKKLSLEWRIGREHVGPYPILSDGLVILPANSVGDEGQTSTDLCVIEPSTGKMVARQLTGGISTMSTLYTQVGSTIFVSSWMIAYELRRKAPMPSPTLEQINAVIASLSQGKVELTTDYKLDTPVKLPKQPIVVYPVNYPFSTEIATVGKGKVLGAAVIHSDTEISGKIKSTVPKGACLLFFQAGADDDHSTISLVSVKVDSDGREEFIKLMEAPAKRTRTDGMPWEFWDPEVSVTYAADKVEEPIVANIDMTWQYEEGADVQHPESVKYEFKLTLPGTAAASMSAPEK